MALNVAPVPSPTAVSRPPYVGGVNIEIVDAALGDKPVLRRLMELYMYDFSELDGRELDQHGLFGYRYLDHYWTAPERHPLLIRCEDRWAGFALVRAGNPSSMAEFFVLRKYRRRGIGREVAQMVFRRFPGRWEVEEVRENPAARRFWQRSIPATFEEVETAEGWKQKFVVESPERC